MHRWSGYFLNMESIEEEPPKSGTSLLKTPVSLLQELYVRKGITPTYDLLQVKITVKCCLSIVLIYFLNIFKSDGAVHEPVFKFRVTVGDLMAVGSGQVLLLSTRSIVLVHSMIFLVQEKG